MYVRIILWINKNMHLWIFKIMKLNKLLCIIIALIVVNTSAYALDISLGGSFGAGGPIFRGLDYKKSMGNVDLLKETFPNFKKTTFAIVPQVDLMLEFIPFLALETGLGFKYSTLNYSDSIQAGDIKAGGKIATRSEIFIPVMLRSQFEYKLGVTYISTGLKIGIPVSDYLLQENEYPSFNKKKIIIAKASVFTLDIAFAVGQEFKIANSHYLGIRVGYDMNVLRPYATSVAVVVESGDTVPSEEETMLDDTDWFQDNFAVALTYRYTFNSKSKKRR